MCGRFTQAYTWAELVALYGLTQPAMNLQPHYNIAPTATIDVLIPRNSDQLELWPMRWGLIPSWWTKTRKELPSTFNARAETITARPMFRDAFRERRCIIPASGYHEWKASFSETPSDLGYSLARTASLYCFGVSPLLLRQPLKRSLMIGVHRLRGLPS